MAKKLKGLHNAIADVNKEYLTDCFSLSEVCNYWSKGKKTEVAKADKNGKVTISIRRIQTTKVVDALKLASNWLKPEQITPAFIIANCKQTKEIEGKQTIVTRKQIKTTENGVKKVSYILSDNEMTLFSPSFVGNVIKNYVYKQMAVISSQVVVPKEETKETPKEETPEQKEANLNTTGTLPEQQKEVGKTEKKVNSNKRQSNSNKQQLENAA